MLTTHALMTSSTQTTSSLSLQALSRLEETRVIPVQTHLDSYRINCSSVVDVTNFHFIQSDTEWNDMTLLAVLIFTISTAGIIGNFAVVLIVACFKDMRTLINISFANLAVSDLLIFFTDAIPTGLDTLGLNYAAYLGCRIPYYMQWVIGQVTCLILAYVSFDRYRVIVQPFDSLKNRSASRIWSILLAAWLFSIVIQLPMTYVGAPNEEGQCQEYAPERGARLFFSLETISIFILPLAIIVVCHFKIWRALQVTKNCVEEAMNLQDGTAVGRLNRKFWKQRRKSIRVVLLVVIIFTIGYAPIHSVHLWYAFSARGIPLNDPLYVRLHTVANVLMYTHSCLTPYIFCFAGADFRKHLREILTCFPLRQKIKGYQVRCGEASTWL